MSADTNDKELDLDETIPVPIGEFISGVKTPVDLYVRLSSDKFVLICKAGTPTQQDQLRTYKDKEVDYLWVQKNQYNKLTKQTIAIAGMAVNHQNLNLQNKSDFVSKAAAKVFNQLEHLGVNLEMYYNAKSISEATIALVENHKDLSALFASLNQHSNSLMAHSLAVSTLSVTVAIEMGWSKRLTLEKLALGGLLHDIGLKALPPDLINKPIAQMTFEESQLYETHAYKGAQLILSLGVVPDDIVSILYEHHENAIGQGYPQRMRDLKMHPLAKIIALVDQFCYLTISNPNCPQAKSPREALVYMEHTLGQPFNKEAFRALQRAIETQPQKKSA